MANADVVALKPKTKRPSPKRRSYDDPLFDEFWSYYPHKVDKKKAHDTWQQIGPDAALAQRITAGAKQYAEYVKRNQIEMRHVKYPQGWLSGERWTDDLNLPAPVGSVPSIEEQQAAREAEYQRIKEEWA